MGAGQLDPDVVVIGGGPAGSGAAIACRQHGLRVHLFERAAFVRERPGDTLHPGVEPLLAQLGVTAALASAVGARHGGIWVDWGGTRRFERFGSDPAGPWRGFQVSRMAFDAIMLARARALGAEVTQPGAVLGLVTDGARITGVRTDRGPVTARMVVDATGRARFLTRALGLARPARSPPLVARYGYVSGSCSVRDDAPALVGDQAGWLWTAMVRPGVYQWTRVTLGGCGPPAGWLPEEFRGLAPLGPSRGADVTWRMTEQVARSGWFMVGEAAAVLDPASSHGVLRALLSGLAAGKLIAAVLNGQAPGSEAAATYQAWLAGWFTHDAAQMAGFYRQLGLSGFG